MALTTEQNLEARKVYELFWESYLSGDERTFVSVYDEDVTLIGTTESEVVQTRTEVVKFFRATVDQVAGKVEVRNRDVRLVPIGDVIYINEFAELHILIDHAWTFYSKVRLTTLMRQTAGEWKIYQQHSSVPDFRVQGEETIAFEQIQKENLELREAVKRRTIDLEHKNRELEIEACLERVRTRAVAMRTPGDLPGVSEQLFKELRVLGFDELRNAMINIHNDENESFINYDYSDELGQSVTPLIYSIHPVIEKQIRQIRSAQDAFSETMFTGKDLEDWKEFRRSVGERDDPRTGCASALYYYFYSIGTGSIGISTFGPVGQSKLDVLKRFRNVFDFAYRRYLDVTEAEARAREAQIEASLERVRAIALGMREPAEMVEVCRIISEQLQLLGVAHIRNVQTAILDDEKGTYLNYEFFAQYNTSSIQEILTKLHPDVEAFANSIRQAPDAFFNMSFSGEPLRDWIEYRKRTNQNPDPLLEQAESVHYYFYSIGPGALGVSAYAPLRDEDLNVFKRFRNVFELAYRRFVDIELAEAQAREAQIEAALERVRARTMAMQRSEELSETSQLLAVQLQQLGEIGEQISIGIFDDRRQLMRLYATVHGQRWEEASEVPYNAHPVIERAHEAWKARSQSFVEDIVGDELATYLKFRDEYRPDRLKRADGPAPARWTIHYAFFSRGLLAFSTQGPRPAEVIQLLERFATAFDLTYTRFLDLQKAEAQAWEATIEAALERVRTQAMAMHSRSDLKKVGATILSELKVLGFDELRNTEILINSKAKESILSHYYSDYGVSGTIDVNYNDHPIVRDWANEMAKGSDAFAEIVIGEDAIDAWRKYRLQIGYAPDPKLDDASAVYYYSHSVGQGALSISSFKPISEDQKNILDRLRNVFGLAYRRFVDIELAESQAREATIEAALERVRAKAMAMHTTSDLSETSGIVFAEMRRLGITAIRSGVVLMSDKSPEGLVYATATSGDIDSFALTRQLSFTGHSSLEKQYACWKNKEDYFITLKRDEVADYYAYLNSDSPAPFLQAVDHKTEEHGYYFHFAEGQFYVWTRQRYTDDELAILGRFKAIIELTFRRYLDLQRAEAQARESQIEACLERVRSRTLAMQKSDELAETAAVLFQQLISLGIAPNRLYIAIMNDDAGSAEFWITDEDGSRVSSGFAADLLNNTTFRRMYDGWKSGETSLTIDMQGQDLQEYLHYLNSLNVPFKGGLSQTRRVQTIAYFAKGFLGIASPDLQPGETTTLLERFAAVFNLTLTRFNDLQLAEAQALQAHSDLIQLQTEKQRAEDALTELRAMQTQLLQQEKLASLGQLTAGIAHEIKNPLNFVNNFSSVSVELLEEVIAEITSTSPELMTGEVQQLLADIRMNLMKIVEHGTRADGIVKSMLQHSRGGSGRKEPTDLNSLVKEYVNLAFHGMRAGKNPINVDIVLELHESMRTVSIISEDFSRVIINLCQNAFDAMREKNISPEGRTGSYLPKLTVRTRREASRVFVEIADNGPGIPEGLKDKILQPFFTTKKGTQGTGLGLSITHDIIKAHGGEMSIHSNQDNGATFVIALPI